ncbi:MAG: (d)CMP kinase [Chloroflexi bacterium]|nr:(d)CMP kinase [Chloroflexota bacterium]
MASSDNEGPLIAIDGPAASGKTVVGKLLAQKLGYRFLDTGVMYRALTWAAVDSKVSPTDVPHLLRLARERPVELLFQDGCGTRVLLGENDVTPHLRDPRVEQAVSLVSQVSGVREVLVAQQRRLAQGGSMVMAGRDIGTVVLADAPFKIFLTASLQERARRRLADLRVNGAEVSYEEVLADLQRRDKLDSEREASPLRPAWDARVVVTDGMTVEQVADFLLSIVRRR